MTNLHDVDIIDRISGFQKFGSILGLERMSMLMERLGNPQEDLKVIHIAGTNGKGSTSKYIYEMLQANGYKTGLYTSPFIEAFNERIEFNGQYISNEDLQKFGNIVIDKADEIVSEGKTSPTEFEIITAIGLLYFREKKADYVVLEAGMGGIGDSTNIIKKPLLSIITSVSLDHTKVLGDTIEAITEDKSGVIKQGCPFITGVKSEASLEVMKKKYKSINMIKDNKKDVHFDNFIMTKDFNIEIKSESLLGCKFDVEIKTSQNSSKNIGLKNQGLFKDMEISMPGRHQLENAVCALTAIQILNNKYSITLEMDKIRQGLKATSQKARFEIIETVKVDNEYADGKGNKTKKPYIIIDGAHNQDGARALKETANKYFRDKKILMVVGILADKAVDDIILEFLGITNEFVITEPSNPRKLNVAELEKKLTNKSKDINVYSVSNPIEAVDRAIELAQKENFEVVLFAGSLYLMGDIRKYIKG